MFEWCGCHWQNPCMLFRTSHLKLFYYFHFDPYRWALIADLKCDHQLFNCMFTVIELWNIIHNFVDRKTKDCFMQISQICWIIEAIICVALKIRVQSANRFFANWLLNNLKLNDKYAKHQIHDRNCAPKVISNKCLFKTRNNKWLISAPDAISNRILYTMRFPFSIDGIDFSRICFVFDFIFG